MGLYSKACKKLSGFGQKSKDRIIRENFIHIFPRRKASHSGCHIRHWVQYFIDNGEFQMHNQGKFGKKKSL